MAIHLEGDEWFPIPPAKLYEKLTDYKFLVRCFPDVCNVVSIDQDNLVFRVRPGFSFIKGTIESTVNFLERKPPVSAKMNFLGKGIGSSVQIVTSIDLVDWLVTVESGDLVPGSKVHWSAEVAELGGLLKMVATGLVVAAAEKSVSVAWSKFRKELAKEG